MGNWGLPPQCQILVTLILIPLLNPEALPKGAHGHAAGGAATATATTTAATTDSGPRVKIQSEMMNNQLTAPSKIPKQIKQITESAAPPPSAGGVAGMGGDPNGAAGGVMGGILGGIGNAAPVVKAAPPKKSTSLQA